MDVRWHEQLTRFLFGFSHADHALKREQRADYDRHVQLLAMNDRWGQALSIVPGVAALVAIPLWIALQKRFPLPVQMGAQVLFAVGVLMYLLWVLRWKHRRHGPRALRELGLVDVCARCGYDLSRQEKPEGRCPECGEVFTRFRPSEIATKGPP